MILHTPHYPIDKSKPGFSVYRNHKLLDSVQLFKMNHGLLNIGKALTESESIVIAEFKTPNGIAYNVIFERVYDNVVLPDDPRILEIPIVLSFQIHSYGNFVVIRNDYSKVRFEGHPDQLRPIFDNKGKAK